MPSHRTSPNLQSSAPPQRLPLTFDFHRGDGALLVPDDILENPTHPLPPECYFILDALDGAVESLQGLLKFPYRSWGDLARVDGMNLVYAISSISLVSFCEHNGL